MQNVKNAGKEQDVKDGYIVIIYIASKQYKYTWQWWANMMFLIQLQIYSRTNKNMEELRSLQR